MTDTQERGEKRGVLSTGRAQKLGKTRGDADTGRNDDELEDAEE